MGYMRHDAVIVTCSDYVLDEGYASLPGFDRSAIDKFRASLPAGFGQLVVGPIQSTVNGYVTWVFAPDGSKENWDTSDLGDRLRKQFIDLFRYAYEDGSSPFDIIEVRFGGDYGREHGAVVVTDSPGPDKGE